MNVIILTKFAKFMRKSKSQDLSISRGKCQRHHHAETSKDWDLTTNTVPEEILKIFPNGFYDNSFGTVGLPVEALAKSGIQQKINKLSKLRPIEQSMDTQTAKT